MEDASCTFFPEDSKLCFIPKFVSVHRVSSGSIGAGGGGTFSDTDAAAVTGKSIFIFGNYVFIVGSG